MAPFPEPKTLDGIVRLFSENKFLDSRYEWLGKGMKVEQYVRRMKNGSVISSASTTFDKMNMYFLYRSLNQVNEACNKLWGTMELYRALVDRKPFFRKFNSEFLSSTTIPGLHYSNMCAMLSTITLFGICPWMDRDQKNRFYNIVRTPNGMILEERTKYLVECFGTTKKGWHQQLIQLHEGLIAHGIGLPTANSAEAKNLLKERNRVHYDILGQTTMKGMYGTSTYMKFLPGVVDNIRKTLIALTDVIDHIPNGISIRFRSLEKDAPNLVSTYSDMGQPVLNQPQHLTR